MTRIKSALSSVLLFMFIAFSACQKSHEIIDPTNPSEPDEPEIRPELILDEEEIVALQKEAYSNLTSALPERSASASLLSRTGVRQ